jgi:hypothetical protein
VARIYLVDAFNLIHAEPVLKRLLEASGPVAAGDRLIDDVHDWLTSHPAPPQVVLVFDGPGPAPGGRTPNLEVRYMDHQADDDLLVLLQRRGNRILVSSDGELVRGAKNLGCPVVKPREFFAELRGETRAHREVAARDRVPSDHEVGEWLEAFGQPRPRKSAQPASEGDRLDDAEVGEWLDYFGERPES